MKIMKVALLATAALTAVSISARADEVSDMKAQLEALNARLAKLEAAPSLPSGYSLISFSEGQNTATPGLVDRERDIADHGTKTNVIGILPTADMPATAEIAWSGFVRAAIVYSSLEGDPQANGGFGDDDLDISTRGEIKVAAKTDTAVGEVGVLFKWRANDDAVFSRGTNPTIVSPEYWGYWSMTPEWTLGGGYTGSLSNVPYGYDGFCACYEVDNSTAFDLNPNDAQQMRLSYVSGPLSFAVAIEDGSISGSTDDSLGGTARIKYDGDAFSIGIMGGYWDDDDYAGGANFSAADNDTNWQIGGGASVSLGDMATLSVGAAAGEFFNGTDYFAVSGGLNADLSETVNFQLGAAWRSFNGFYTSGGAAFPLGDAYAVAGGVYWNPVDQLTIGLESEWSTQNSDDTVTVDLVTVFRF
jgi:hypothetical protein